jgi:hypothetical protein
LNPMQPIPRGKLVNFKPLREGWSDYSLADGTILRIRVVVTKVTRMENPDGSPAFTPTGEPAYFVQSQNVFQVLTPAEYKALMSDEPKE